MEENTIIFPNINIEPTFPFEAEAEFSEEWITRLIVCITYRAQGSEKIHHAARAFILDSQSESISVDWIIGNDSIG